MAVIRLRKNGGGKAITVTESAYRNFYASSSSWVRVDNEGAPISAPTIAAVGFAKQEITTKPELSIPDEDVGEGENDRAENSLTDEELLEIPVAEMSKAQVREAARIIGFDYKAAGLKKLPAVREALAKKLAER